MDDEEYYRMLLNTSENKIGCGTPVIATIIVFVLFMLSSCATKTKVEYIEKEVVKYETKIQHDTLINNIHDSIYHTVFQKGDTIYDTKYIEKTMFRDRIVVKIDTFYRDSIQTQIKEITVEKIKISKLCYFSLVFCIIFFIFAIYKLIRWLH